MRKFLLILAILFAPVLASAQTTVTGHVKDLGGNNLTNANSNAFIRFRLRNFAGNVPRLNGTGSCASGAVGLAPLSVLPDGTGSISLTICGDDVITPANTFYTVEYWYNGVIASQYNFTIAGGSVNLDTAVPLSSASVVAPLGTLSAQLLALSCNTTPPPPTPTTGFGVFYESCTDKNPYFIDSTGRFFALGGTTSGLGNANTWTGLNQFNVNVLFNGVAANFIEDGAPGGSTSQDFLWGDSAAHRLKFNSNNAGADFVVGAATTDTFTNKTFDTAGAGNVFKVNGTALSAVTGSGGVVLATSPTLSGPRLTASTYLQDPTGTYAMSIILKKGSGNGTDYTTASATYVDVDAANLALTQTIPIGWRLGVSVKGTCFTNTGVTNVWLGILDSSVVEQQFTNPEGITAGTACGVDWVINGDGNSHLVKLQYHTDNVSDAAGIKNGSTNVPTMIFTLMPSP